MHVLEIEWRHFDQEGNTCIRCSETGAALQKAVTELAEECQPKGWELRFQETKLPAQRMEESNLILINGKPLEQLLPHATLRQSHCQSCCEMLGSEATQCRAIELDGRLYEGIPWQLIRQAVCAAAQCC
ncbi:DUF2703 domain-containing protein [Candidatus Electronema sp. PJ]|uniref:DUF2703 domain-containing protein n=1 Tax=Candidatus Electronema sp. PJ TaxID=3401572 RepID=UPI003AA92586